MNSRGDQIKAACENAKAMGALDHNGRPLPNYIAMKAFGRTLASFTYGERRGIEEQIERWWEEHNG